MIRLLQYLIYGHVHVWEVKTKDKLKDTHGDLIGQRITCACKTCGAWKKFDLI